MTIKPDPKSMPFSADDIDRMFVLVATYTSTGELAINTVVRHDSAVNAALTAHYAKHKDALSKKKLATSAARQSATATALSN